MIHKIGKYLILLFFLIFFFPTPSAQATIDNQTKVHLIFNQISYEVGEEIKLTINLENFTNLSETKIMIKCDESVYVPLLKNNQYGQLLSNSIYEEAMLNDYVDGYIRFQLVKKNLTDGYYSGYKNQVGEFYFEAKKKISNIYDYFEKGNFTTLSCGINVTLYDIYNQTIENTVFYSEKIQMDWRKEKYIVEVYEAAPNYLEDLIVRNRKENEYELLIEDKIDTSKLGSQIINIAVIDKVNADYMLLSKVVEVKDLKSPVIEGENEVLIYSDIIHQFRTEKYFKVFDNYDALPLLTIEYYKEEGVLLKDEDDFLNYLLCHREGYVLIQAKDSSGNKSPFFKITIQIKDVTPPQVTILTSLSVQDTSVDTFNFEDYVSVLDTYDEEATLVYNAFFNEMEVIEYQELLKVGNQIVIRYFGMDKEGNTSEEYECLLSIVDTTPPSLSKIEDIELKDREVIHYDFLAGILSEDTIDTSPKIVCKFYQKLEKNVELDEETWRILMAKGYLGYIEYYAVDKSGNKSTSQKRNVGVLDETSPVIQVSSIKDGSKYISVDKIEYSIVDNFDGEMEIEITLNGVQYKGENIKQPGNYEFRIYAKDKHNNESSMTIQFTIIENNVVGCGNDFECYWNNYVEIVIIVGILMAIIMTIFVVKVCHWRKKKRLD